jgi:hypothetical protein
MLRTARRGLLLAAVAAGLAVSPAQAAYETWCPADPVEYFADGSFIYSNGTDAGCVTARVHPSGGASLYRVVVAPGWTYKVKSNGGTTNGSRVEVQFERGRERVSIRMEAGRTVIK